MTHPSTGDIILQCFVVLALIAFIVTKALVIAGRVIRWFERHGFTPHVEHTVNQMFGDVHVNREHEPTFYAAKDIAKRRG